MLSFSQAPVQRVRLCGIPGLSEARPKLGGDDFREHLETVLWLAERSLTISAAAETRRQWKRFKQKSGAYGSFVVSRGASGHEEGKEFWR